MGRARTVAARASRLVARRLTPERTRRATFFERHTVGRLTWAQLTRLNQALELVGRLTTVLLIAFAVSTVVGVDWRGAAEEVVNSGRPVQGALAVAVVFVLLTFVALRSVIGFGRWRIQRELWRRDVAALQRREAAPPAGVRAPGADGSG